MLALKNVSHSDHLSLGYIIISGTVGNLIEWYNFLLYGYLAPVIAQLFFPSHNKLISLTLTFTVFALGFFARPCGGILLGWIGDTYGRQRALLLSLIMMTVPTILIACLPTYNRIGILSPILLCIFRIVQGLSAGGEHTGSAVYLAEYAPAQRRSLWVSTVPTSAALGVLMSSLASLILINSFTPTQLLTWGWRAGYGIGALLCLISIFLRIATPETPSFQKIQMEKINKRYSMVTLLTEFSLFKKLLIVIGLASSWGICYQILFIWMPTYFVHVRHLSNSVALQANSLFILCFALLILGAGYIADYIKPKLLLVFSCVAMIILAYPLFELLAIGSLRQIYLAMGIFTLIFSLYIATAFVIMVELFNTEIRYTGLSLGFNMGLAIFGGTCPLIATWLIQVTGNNSAPAFYMMLTAVFALLLGIKSL